MKRIAIMALVLGLALVVMAGCSSDSDDEDDEENLGAGVADTTTCPTSPDSADPFEDAVVFIERSLQRTKSG